MKSFKRLRPIIVVLAAIPLAVGCVTTPPPLTLEFGNRPPAPMADSAVTSTDLAAVFGAGSEGGDSKMANALPVTASGLLKPEEALRVAAQKNPSFAEYAAARDLALAEIMEATAWRNPSLEAGIGRGETRGSPSVSGLEYSLGLIQPVEWPGKRGNRKMIAEAGVKVAELDETLFCSTLRADVLRTYWIAAFCAKDLEIENRLLDSAKIESQMAEALRANGEMPETGMVLFRQELLRLEQEWIALRGERDMALLLLNKLCGLGLPKEASPSLLSALPPTSSTINGGQALALALRKHPAILKLDAEKRRCELAVEQAELAKRPDFTPGLEASRGVDVLSWGARLGMELPFWNRNEAGIAAANAELRRVKAQLAMKQQEIEAAVEAALLACANAAERQGRARSGFVAAQAATQRTQAAAASGETDQFILVAARRQQEFAARTLLRADLEAILARIQLEQAIGYGELK